jgi:hypothetical protein
MQCTHEFHFLCLADWLRNKKHRCPCCRHTDLFLEIDSEFMKTVRDMRVEQAQPEPQFKVYINGDGDIVEGDEDSDFSFSSE